MKKILICICSMLVFETQAADNSALRARRVSTMALMNDKARRQRRASADNAVSAQNNGARHTLGQVSKNYDFWAELAAEKAKQKKLLDKKSLKNPKNETVAHDPSIHLALLNQNRDRVASAGAGAGANTENAGKTS